MKKKNENQSQKTIFTEMKKVFLQWANQEEVTQEELANFLKSINDVAKKNKITELEKIATDNLLLVNKRALKNFKKKQWQLFITPFISLMDKNSIESDS